MKSKKDIFEKRKRRGERNYLRRAEIHPFNPKRIEKRAKAMRKRSFGRAKARRAPGRAPNIPKRDNVRKSCRLTNRRRRWDRTPEAAAARKKRRFFP